MIDVYNNLPSKMAGFLNWMQKNCANFKGFFLKLEDYLYLSVRTVEYFIHSYDPFSPTVFGKTHPNPFPMRSKIVYISLIDAFLKSRRNSIRFLSIFYILDEIGLDQWPWKDYPQQSLSRSAYILTHEAIVPLLAAIQTTPMTNYEDIYLTGICAEKANVEIKKMPVYQDAL